MKNIMELFTSWKYTNIQKKKLFRSPSEPPLITFVIVFNLLLCMRPQITCQRLPKHIHASLNNQKMDVPLFYQAFSILNGKNATVTLVLRFTNEKEPQPHRYHCLENRRNTLSIFLSRNILHDGDRYWVSSQRIPWLEFK